MNIGGGGGYCMKFGSKGASFPSMGSSTVEDTIAANCSVGFGAAAFAAGFGVTTLGICFGADGFKGIGFTADFLGTDVLCYFLSLLRNLFKFYFLLVFFSSNFSSISNSS